MTKKQLRELAKERPEDFRRIIAGSRRRELQARHLILHPEEVPRASVPEREALMTYIKEGRWRRLYNHDRRMYRLLRKGVEQLTQEGELTSNGQSVVGSAVGVTTPRASLAS